VSLPKVFQRKTCVPSKTLGRDTRLENLCPNKNEKKSAQRLLITIMLAYSPRKNRALMTAGAGHTQQHWQVSSKCGGTALASMCGLRGLKAAAGQEL